MNIAIHAKLNVSVAIQLLQIVMEVSRRNVIFTRISLKLLLTILNRFENNIQIYEFLQAQVRHVMKIILNQDQIKLEIYHILNSNPKNLAIIRKKQIEQNNSVQQLEQKDPFSSYNPNSHNIKLNGTLDKSTNLGKSIIDKSKGIVSHSAINGECYLDDSDIQALMNPQGFQEESSQYMSIRTHEKMIINQLQCLINTGGKVLSEYIRSQILDTYIKIERKFKFKNKGLLYILNLFEKDVTKMLQYYNNEQIKQRAEKLRLKTIVETRNKNQANVRLDSQRPSQVELPKIIKTVSPDQRSTRQGYKMKVSESMTVVKPLRGKQMIDNPSLSYQLATGKKYDVKAALKNRPNSLSVHSSQQVFSQQRILGEPVPVRALFLGKSLEVRSLKLFDILACPQIEIEKYSVWLKQYMKLYKSMFHKYAVINQSKKVNQIKTFDDMQSAQQLMSISEVFLFMNDFKIITTNNIKRDDIKRIIKLINLKSDTNSKSFQELDQYGFIELILQLSSLTNPKESKPSKFLPLFFRYLKEVSLAQSKPLFQRLLLNPNATTIADQDLINQLTAFVNEDPNYKLPPGFIKSKCKQLIDKYEPDRDNVRSVQICEEIFDDLFFKEFGIHSINPQATMVERWIVKPDIFQQQMSRKLKPKYQQIGEKHQFSAQDDLSQQELEHRSLNKDLPMKHGKSVPRIIGFQGKQRLDIVQEQSVKSTGRNSVLAKPKSQVKLNPLYRQALPSQVRENNIDMTLKIEVAQNLMHPLRYQIKESALLLEDMLRAIETGHTDEAGHTVLTPRAKRKIWASKPLTKDGKIVNQAIAFRNAEKEKELLQKQKKQDEFLQRQAYLQKSVDQYKKEKFKNNLIKNDQKKEDERVNKLKQHMESVRRAEFYAEVKDKYEEENGPANKAKELEKQNTKKLELDQKRKNKEQSEQKVQQTIILLQKSFEEKIRIKKNEIQKKELEEKRQKEFIDKNNEKYLDGKKRDNFSIREDDEPLASKNNVNKKDKKAEKQKKKGFW